MSATKKKCDNPDCGRLYKPYAPYVKKQRICGLKECREWLRRDYRQRKDSALDRNKYMEKDEMEAFLGAVEGDLKWKSLFRLMINGCLRIGEVGSIMPGSFDLDNHPPMLRVKTLKKKGHPILPVDIDRATIKEVLAYAKDADVKEDEPIWPMSKQTIWNMFKAVLKAAKIRRKFTTHSLRHTGILLRASAAKTVEDFEWIRQSARHSNAKVTMIYLHTTGKRRKELVGKVKWA